MDDRVRETEPMCCSKAYIILATDCHWENARYTKSEINQLPFFIPAGGYAKASVKVIANVFSSCAPWTNYLPEIFPLLHS